MPDLVLGALITASGAIVVALISVWQHRSAERDRTEAVETQKRLEHSEALFSAYRNLLDELRTELAREQGDKTRMRDERDHARKDRDQWMRRAVAAERQVEQWIEKES